MEYQPEGKYNMVVNTMDMSFRPHHNEKQIAGMEAYYALDAFPDNQQRHNIGQALGLTDAQVKYWFQNKRTQTKRKKEYEDKLALQEEIKRLEEENKELKAALEMFLVEGCCMSCSLRRENAKLQEELERLKILKFGYPSLSTLDEISGSSFNYNNY